MCPPSGAAAPGVLWWSAPGCSCRSQIPASSEADIPPGPGAPCQIKHSRYILEMPVKDLCLDNVRIPMVSRYRVTIYHIYSNPS